MTHDPRTDRLSPEVVRANLTDLDYAIFEALPEVGQKLGYHPMFKSAKKLVEELNANVPSEARMGVGALGARLRSLSIGELVAPVSTQLNGRTSGWQRTAVASELLRKREEGAAAARYRDEQAQASDWTPGAERGEA